LPEATVTERKIWYWSIPQAFVKGAIANNATSRKVGANTVVSFTANNKYKLEGTFNAANDLIDVKGWAPSPIFGDMLIEVQKAMNHRLSLDSIATSTFGVEKTSEGLQAIRWYKEGKLAEIGTYQELMDKDGLFAALARRQMV